MEAKNITFSYGKKLVLKDISARFDRGKLYALIGPNGSGKTTLIKLLSRIYTPRSGELFLNEKSYREIGRKDFAKLAALLPQGRNIPNMSVYELVSCGRYPYLDLSRKLTAQDREAVEKALRATATDIFAHTHLQKLSGGERQRAYIAMLLSQNTDYVLLDEPTTHLDISSKFDIMELLRNMSAEGKCVVTVLHDLELALRYADEIVLMADGQLIAHGTAEEMIRCGKLPEVFGVDCSINVTEGETFYHFTQKTREKASSE